MYFSSSCVYHLVGFLDCCVGGCRWRNWVLHSKLQKYLFMAVDYWNTIKSTTFNGQIVICILVSDSMYLLLLYTFKYSEVLQ